MMKDNTVKTPMGVFDLEESAPLRKALFENLQAFSKQITSPFSKTEQAHEATEADLSVAINTEKTSWKNLLSCFQEQVLNTVPPNPNAHLGDVSEGGIYSAALGSYLAALTKQHRGSHAFPGAVKIEDALIHWAAKLMGYPEGFGGHLCSGAAMATLSALYTARHHKGISPSLVSKQVVYCTAQTHQAIHSFLKKLGLEKMIVRDIALDASYKISIKALHAQIKHDKHIGLCPFLIFASAGSYEVGAIDPLTSLGTISKKHDLWLHVDASYGGFFMSTALGSDLLKGIAQANSIVLDPHKGLFMPPGLALLLVKDSRHLRAAQSLNTELQKEKQHRHLSALSLHRSLKMNPLEGLQMWLPLKLYGTSAFSEYLNEKLQLAFYLYQELKKMGYKVLCEPNLNTVVFRLELKAYHSDLINDMVLDYIQNDGKVSGVTISSIILNGKLTLRAALVSFKTHQEDIDVLLHVLKKIKRHLDV